MENLVIGGLYVTVNGIKQKMDAPSEGNIKDFNIVGAKILSNIKSNIQICLFGDVYQNIYKFKNSDDRNLRFANKIFESDRKWTRLTLSVSYRLTNEIAQFVNKGLLNHNRIKTVKSGPKVRYLICNSYNDPYNEVLYYLKIKKYKPEDIFILGPSIRAKTPIINLENKLVKMNISCYVPINDDDVINPVVIQNKLC
jgi:hypothetical protein